MNDVINIECFKISCNCYLVTDDKTNKVLVVDPGEVCPSLENRIREYDPDNLEYILLTHGHYDHTANAANLKKKYPSAKIVIGEKEKDFATDSMLNLSTVSGVYVEKFKPDILVSDGTQLPFGSVTIDVMETPGHTAGGVCYKIENNIFSGDTLFRLSMGRTDFPTGNIKEIGKSLKRLYELDGNPDIYSGHGDSTTLEFERKNNPYMRKSLL